RPQGERAESAERARRASEPKAQRAHRGAGVPRRRPAYSLRVATSATETSALARATEVFGAIADNVERVVQGKSDVIHLVVLCLVAEGHLLIEDVPGVGKTSLAKALATSLD